MIAREFIIEKKLFLRRKLTILQHKLRVVMKCYTVVNFQLDDNENKFSFQKSYRISKVRIDDENVNTGGYSIEEIPTTDKILLKIYVD
jgi:hypothetical protein